jgi:hypothetical protein
MIGPYVHPYQSIHNPRRAQFRVDVAIYVGSMITMEHVHLIFFGNPCHNQEGTNKGVHLLGMCAMLKILDIIQKSVSCSEVNHVHLFQNTTTTLEITHHELPHNGYYKFIYLQYDLRKEI